LEYLLEDLLAIGQARELARREAWYPLGIPGLERMYGKKRKRRGIGELRILYGNMEIRWPEHQEEEGVGQAQGPLPPSPPQGSILS
jgi:hypothetical protein